MQWYNEPPEWSDDDGIITLKTAPDTDFWRLTRHDYVKDDAHFYYETISGDFVAQVRFRAAYNALYDQAGLMLRENETTWLKCGVEYLDGVQAASTVITRDFSDWSIVTLPDNPPYLWLRLERVGNAIEISFSVDGEDYTLMRQGYLSDAQVLQVGVMCASPRGNGFTARFDHFTVG
jgi:regulation of enolase protein 1 (concanavalin A-like superfamily)